MSYKLNLLFLVKGCTFPGLYQPSQPYPTMLHIANQHS